MRDVRASLRRVLRRRVDNPVDRGLCDGMVPRAGLGVDAPRAGLTFRRLHELGVNRLQELAPPHRTEELLHLWQRRLVVMLDRHEQPLVQNLGIAGLGQVELALQPRHVGIFLRAQKMQPLMRGPAARIGGPTGFDAGEGIGVRLGGSGRHAGAEDPLVQIDGCRQLPPDVVQEIGGGDAAEGEVVEVGAQECIEALAAGGALDGAQINPSESMESKWSVQEPKARVSALHFLVGQISRSEVLLQTQTQPHTRMR